jgi:hypothetical protein
VDVRHRRTARVVREGRGARRRSAVPERLHRSASGRAALYRRDAGATAFDRCQDERDEWFDGNIDSHCVAAVDGTVVFGTEDGRAFLSDDGGNGWREVLGGSSRVTCVGVAAA